MHRFLCLVSAPVLLAPIDAKESVKGVMEVAQNGYAVIAEIDGEIVGSLGLLCVKWWYAKNAMFLTDRWFFSYPALRSRGVGALLLAEGVAFGTKNEMDVVINGHMRRRGAGRVYFTHPTVIAPGADIDFGEIADRVLN